MRLLAILMLASAALRGVTIDGFDYKDTAALQKTWQPQGESKPAEFSMAGDMVRAMKLPCSFAELKDWRVYWDRDVNVDLSGSEQIVIKLKSPDPSAVGQAILYFRSGKGWYRMPAFSVGANWEEKVIAKSQAAAEDQPSGWDKIDHLRLAFLPGAKRDTVVMVGGLSGRSGWPISYLGSVGGYKNLEAASAGLKALAKGKPSEKDVAERLKKAAAIAAKVALEKDSEIRQDLILEGRKLVSEAYALVQEPKAGEFRCVWVHNGDGLRALGGDRVVRWKEAIPALRAAGFNAIAPNMLWSGVAFYPSKVVPTSPKVKTDGDFLQEIIDAAKPIGMKVHVWKVMWQFAEGWLAEPGVSEPFRKKGKLQLDINGKEQPWLCPCDDDNRDYEMKALMEAANYPIDGLHLDYIRFSGQEVSYSKMCRKRFEASHPKVVNWPKDCGPGGSRFEEYAEFKREVITSFVREVKQTLKKKNPTMELSAAVFSYVGIARDSVSQDWPRWAKEGIVDWLSSMTYTEDAAGFKSAVALQQEAMGGSKTRLYPGMQTTFDAGRVVDLDTLVDEIRAVRDLGLGGYTFFEYRDQMHDTVLPYLAAGLTREGDYQLAIREQPSYSKVAVPQKGKALRAPGSSLLIDDFEDGNLMNNVRGAWEAQADSNKMGTTYSPKPLTLFIGGAGKSKHALGITGHIGKNEAPWPYVMLMTPLAPGGDPADLSAFKAVAFKAKGDGKKYEVVLAQDAVKDYSYYNAPFTAGKEWAEVLIPFKQFNQAGWAKPVKRSFVDVKLLEFRPSGLSDEDYEFQIDDVRLLK